MRKPLTGNMTANNTYYADKIYRARKAARNTDAFDASEKYYNEVRTAALKVFKRHRILAATASPLAIEIACEAANNSDFA